jgi:hypothetical protein
VIAEAVATLHHWLVAAVPILPTSRQRAGKINYRQGKTMKRVTILTSAFAALLATVGLFAVASHAKDEPVAQQGFSEKLNKMHAQMEAKGWKFGDLEIYTEDGDMKGAFVTYVH